MEALEDAMEKLTASVSGTADAAGSTPTADTVAAAGSRDAADTADAAEDTRVKAAKTGDEDTARVFLLMAGAAVLLINGTVFIKKRTK